MCLPSHLGNSSLIKRFDIYGSPLCLSAFFLIFKCSLAPYLESYATKHVAISFFPLVVTIKHTRLLPLVQNNSYKRKLVE